MDIEVYPKRLIKTLIELDKSTDLASEHKLLLDLGETLLTHITGIIFGEYKRNWDINDALESEFYRNAKKKPSFGVFLGLLRLLIKADGKSVCDEYFEKGKSYPAVSEFVFNYNLLKSEVVNKGQDSGLAEALEPLKKGRTVASKSGMDFFESFVNVRNTYAHPEEKAKNPLRNWPMGDEYYGQINPLMKEALTEIISGFTVLSTHRPVLVKEIDDQQRKVIFIVEIGKKEKELILELSDKDFDFVNTDVRYLLDQDNKLLSKFYQAEVPQVNPSVAKQIIEKERAKMMEPILVGMIEKKLEDEVIDELEYMILKDTALSSFISEEDLKRMIDKIKTKKGLEGSVYIGLKKSDVRPLLNPYWLVHFGTLKESKVEQSEDYFNTTNLHKNIWNQINQYLEYLIQSHLDNEFVKWKIKANQYQIGNLSYTYWGQIYPDHSPFEYGFSIGFIISGGFTNKWGLKTKKNNPIKNKVGQPCIFLYTTLNNKFIDDVDHDVKLQKEYGLINYDLLKREQQKLEEMGALTNALCYRTNDATTIKDYFLQKEESENDERLWIYSKIWNVDDFIENNAFNNESAHQIEKEVITYLTLFSNSVLAINDYAISNGFNAEQIKDMRDRATRNQQILVSEVKDNLNKDSKYIKDFVIRRGTELKLRKDRIQIVVNMFSTNENPK